MQDPTCKVGTTSRAAILNIIRVTQQDPLTLPTLDDTQQDPLTLPMFDDITQQDPPTLPTFDDITTEQHFYDLIISSFKSGHLPMHYFGLTPVDPILPGA